jgi:hypothetical protein
MSNTEMTRIAHDAITILYHLGQTELAFTLSERYKALTGSQDRP